MKQPAPGCALGRCVHAAWVGPRHRSWLPLPHPLSMGLCPHLGSWHNSSSSGRNISRKHYTWQTATRPQIMAGHTPRFRAGSDRVSQHGLTQRTLYFSLKQSQIMLFSKAGLPLNSLSLTLPVGCTLPSLSYGFIPAVPHLLHLRATWVVPSPVPSVSLSSYPCADSHSVIDARQPLDFLKVTIFIWGLNAVATSLSNPFG